MSYLPTSKVNNYIIYFMKKFFTIVLFFILLWNVIIFYVDSNLSTRYDTTVYNGIDKIWPARGLYDSREEQNSLKAIKKAFEAGAVGVEIDFHYDTNMHKFIISHNHPKKDKNGNFVYTLKDGRLLTLEDVFKQTGKGHYFYLDYKNLDKLSDKETQDAIKRLDEITKDDNLKDRLYMEGSNPFKVQVYTKAGFKTLLGIHPLPEKNPLSSIVINAYKIAYYFFDISALAMNYAHHGDLDKVIYGKHTRKLLKDIPVFIFHIPVKDELLKELVNIPQVRVMLVGCCVSVDKTYIRAEKNTQ